MKSISADKDGSRAKRHISRAVECSRQFGGTAMLGTQKREEDMSGKMG